MNAYIVADIDVTDPEAIYGSPEYQALKAIRVGASNSRLVVVEGC